VELQLVFDVLEAKGGLMPSLATSTRDDTSRLLSIVLLSYQSEGRLRPAVEEAVGAMETAGIPFELIIMDDGSSDRSFELARELAREDARIRAFQLSRNYSSPYSLFAGLSVARGACVASIPDDHQCPMDVIVEMYRLWQQGAKVVVGHRRTRNDGRINDFFSSTYYKIMNHLSDVAFPPGGCDRFLADREIVDLLNSRIHPINTTPVLEVLRLGFSPVFVPYDRPQRSGPSRWTLRKKIRLAAATFFGASSWPLRLITVLGLSVFVACFFLVLLIVWARIYADRSLFGLATNGWATSMVVMAMFNGLILLSMGIVAEYIWRIHEEVKGRPGFVIREADDDDPSDGMTEPEGP
jgi:glycosyltransferase involved in cell wall biosynthesis